MNRFYHLSGDFTLFSVVINAKLTLTLESPAISLVEEAFKDLVNTSK